jgi:hypothetical protein
MGMSSCWGAGSELVEQLVAQREIGGGQSDQGSYQVALGDPAAEQPADVQGELVEVRGGVGLEQNGELAGRGRFGRPADHGLSFQRGEHAVVALGRRVVSWART